MRSTLKLHDRLTLLAAHCCPLKEGQRLVRLADMARVEVLAANAAEPYDHRIYKFWERTFEMYLDRLLGDELGAFIADACRESGEQPSWVIHYCIKEGH